MCARATASSWTERVAGPPDIAVEITCEDSHERDHEIKKRLYESAGVSEYWIIDPAAKHVDFFVRDDRYEAMAADKNRIYRSTVIPGFWLDTEWFFTDPLPDDAECLSKILNG